MKNLKVWQIVVIVVVFLGSGGGVFTWRERAEATTTSALPANTQLVAVQLGTVSSSVSASGSLAFPKATALTFGGTGTVLEVNVKIGDSVKKGQVLARIDTEALERAVAQARLSSMTAEVNLEKAREPYTPGDAEKAQATVSQAEVALERAQKSLQDARSSDPVAVGARQAAVAAAEESLRQAQTPDLVVVATRQAAVDLAQANMHKSQDDLAELESTYSTDLAKAEATVAQVAAALQNAKEEAARALGETAIQMARANVQAKTADLQAAQDALAALKSTSATSIARAQATVKQAQAAFDQSKNDLEKVSTPDPVVVASRQATLKQAQNELALLVAQRQAEVDAASASLLNARENLETIKAGADPDDLSMKELQYQLAKTALDEAEEQLVEAAMVAPGNGIVAAVNISVGQKVSGDVQAITLVDASTMEVNAVVSEIDVSLIKQGQRATLSLDSLPGVVLTGSVSTISVIGKSASGVVSYPITIQVTAPEGVQLREGMSTTATLVVQQVRNVLVVPNRAVGGTGSNPAVKTMVAGKVQEVAVKLGLSDSNRTEVVEGLKEGDMVLVNTSGSSQQRFFGPGMPGGGGQIMQMFR